MSKLIIVDDEKNIRESLKIILEQEGYSVDCAENGLSAQRLLIKNTYNAGIFDLKMPGLNGLELLAWLNDTGIKLPVIMISAFGQVSDAVQALKTGANDYIVKPFDPDILIEKIALLDNGSLKDTMNSVSSNSPIMRKLNIRIERIAKSRSTVLINGESGVGKEVTARIIHADSMNADSPFIALNMGGISDTLAESELFGYEKGAFTGANAQKKGMLELAGEGTLFLDEIGEMPLALQVKLLRVLQDKTFRRLGGVSDIGIKSRLITATNRNLEQMVKDGTFREDLFYRLNVARITLPSLRERKEDLPLLVKSLLEKLNKKMGLSVGGLSNKAWIMLNNYSFPGNIRELENILERSMIFVDGTEITHEDLELPKEENDKENSTIVKDLQTVKTLKEQEKDAIIGALHRWEGNRSRASEELGISRRTIINKIKEYQLKQ